MKIEEYRNIPAVNQSYLKALLSYSSEKIDLVNKRNLHFDLGNAVEIGLLYPHKFEELVIIKDIKIPSGVIGSIILDMIDQGFTNFDDAKILELAAKYNYGNGQFKDDRIIKDVKSKGEDYFTNMLEANGKILLTVEEGTIVFNCVQALRDFFNDNSSLFNYESEIQKVFIDEIREVNCKGLLDIYNPESNSIVDLKVTSFPNPKVAARNFRYDFQLSFYNRLVNKDIGNSDCYLIFVNKNTFNVTCLKLTSYDLEVGKSGTCYYKKSILENGELKEVLFKRETPLYGWEFALELHKNNKNLKPEQYITGIYD